MKGWKKVCWCKVDKLVKPSDTLHITAKQSYCRSYVCILIISSTIEGYKQILYFEYC